MIKKIVFLFLLALSTNSLFAQTIGNNVTSEAANRPNAGGSQSSSDIVNVDLYTGIGNVTIPIYDYTIDGLDLGVSLTYNTKGIKVDQVSSSVGLGWELNTGGGLYRMVRELEDEIIMDGFIGLWTEHPGGTSIKFEHDYDVYSANLGGRNVEFLIHVKDSNLQMFKPKAEMKVKFVEMIDDTTEDSVLIFPPYDHWSIFGYGANGRHINFTIIDEKGNQFLFQRGSYQHKKYMQNDTVSDQLWVTETWNLKKVITYTGAEIKYNYAKAAVDYPYLVEEKIKEVFQNGTTDGFIDPNYQINKLSWTGYQAHITSIEYPNGVTVYFDIDNGTNSRCDMEGAYRLKSIKVKSEYDHVVNNSITYKLNHTYFHTPHTNNGNTEIAHGTGCNTLDNLGWGYYSHNYSDVATRLKLNSIDRVGTDNTTTERFYTFDYHSTPLPHRFAFEQDYYGYYNNGTTTLTPSNAQNFPNHKINVPYHSFNIGSSTMYFGVNKTPDTTPALTYLQAGLLIKVTNGMGGTIEIKYNKPSVSNPNCSYRSDNYKNPDNSTVAGCGVDPDLQGSDASDGLIVTEIAKKDGYNSNNDILTKYTYVDGQRFFRGGYFWYPTKINYNHTINTRLYTNFFVTPHEYFRGSNHGYSNVKVETFNLSTNERLEYKKYKYSNLMLPASLSELFVDDQLNNGQYVAPYFPAAGPGIVAGGSNLHQNTGLLYHTAPPTIMETHLMGNILSVEVFDKNNDLKSKTVNLYDLNVVHIDSGIHVGIKNTVRESTYSYFNHQNIWIDLKFPGTRRWQLAGGVLRLRKQTTTNYSGTSVISTTYDYEYDIADNLRSISWQDSKGDYYKKEYFNTNDYNTCNTCLPLYHNLVERVTKVFPGLPSYNVVIGQSIIHPILVDTTKVYPAISDPNYHNPHIPKLRFSSIYKSAFSEPITVSEATTDANAAVAGTTGLQYLLRETENTVVDDKNNVLEIKHSEQNKFTSFIWDSRIGEKTAEVSNARWNEIAYSSFEGFTRSSSNPADYGNWTFDTSYVKHDYLTSLGKVPTGRFCYELSSGNAPLYCTVPGTPLYIPRQYIISVWCHHEPLVTFGPNNDTIDIEPVTPIIQGGWRMYQGTVNALESNQQLHVKRPASITTYVDEVRLYPVEAMMTTKTYEPLFGVSSTCDAKSNINYFEYDKQGRLLAVRNMYGKVKLKKETVYQQPDNN